MDWEAKENGALFKASAHPDDWEHVFPGFTMQFGVRVCTSQEWRETVVGACFPGK